MSGNQTESTKSWYAKCEFTVGPAHSVQAIIEYLQDLIKDITTLYELHTILGYPEQSPQIQRILNQGAPRISPNYVFSETEIYCIPNAALDKIEEPEGVINPAIFNITAFVTNKEEIIFFIMIQSSLGFMIYKPLVLIPELEMWAKISLASIAEQAGNQELQKIILEESKFTSNYDNVQIISSKILCTNFLASTKKPILKASPSIVPSFYNQNYSPFLLPPSYDTTNVPEPSGTFHLPLPLWQTFPNNNYSPNLSSSSRMEWPPSPRENVSAYEQYLQSPSGSPPMLFNSSANSPRLFLRSGNLLEESIQAITQHQMQEFQANAFRERIINNLSFGEPLPPSHLSNSESAAAAPYHPPSIFYAHNVQPPTPMPNRKRLQEPNSNAKRPKARKE